MTKAELRLSRRDFMPPIAAAIDSMGLDSNAIIAQYLVGFSEKDAHHIPSDAIYKLAESCATETQDLYFGCKAAYITAGEIFTFYELGDPEQQNLSDVLTKLVIAQHPYHNTAMMKFIVDGKRASIIQKHGAVHPDRTAQVDAWGITTLRELIGDMVGPAWNEHDIVVFLANPETILSSTLAAKSLRPRSKSGYKFTFPAEWLLLGPNATFSPAGRDIKKPPSNFIEAVYAALLPHVGSRSFSLDEAATYMGISTRKLQSKLAKNNSSFNELWGQLKRDFAETALLEGIMQISEIADALGYSDSSAFSRAFKNWTGFSPNQFRKST